jgi:hypothetical protein
MYLSILVEHIGKVINGKSIANHVAKVANAMALF